MEENFMMSNGGAGTGVPASYRADETLLRKSAWFVLPIYMLLGFAWFSLFVFRRAGSKLPVIFLCLAYGSMSVTMLVINKTLMALLMAPAVIAVAQMAVAAVGLGFYSGAALLQSDPHELRWWLIVPTLFAALVVSSTYSYEYFSLSMLTVVGNLSPMVAIPVERMVMPVGQQPPFSSGSAFGILVMLAGAVTYSWGLEAVSAMGLSICLLHMLVAVADRVVMRRLLTQECKSLEPGVCALVSNLFGIIPSLILAVSTKQFVQMTNPVYQRFWTSPVLLSMLLVSGLVGMCMSGVGFEAQRRMTATSFFVMQNCSKVVVVLGGVVVFNDPVDSFTIVGVLLSIVGSAIYGESQIVLRQEEEERLPINADVKGIKSSDSPLSAESTQ